MARPAPSLAVEPTTITIAATAEPNPITAAALLNHKPHPPPTNYKPHGMCNPLTVTLKSGFAVALLDLEAITFSLTLLGRVKPVPTRRVKANSGKDDLVLIWSESVTPWINLVQSFLSLDDGYEEEEKVESELKYS